MTNVCYPPGADWSCAYTDEQAVELDPVAVDRANAYAWLSLSALTGQQIAVCPITVRPCRASCGAPGTWMVAPVLSSGNFAGVRPGVYSQFMPHVSATGAWVNSCGCDSTDCGCGSLCEVILPGPVGDVTEVWLNGAALDPSAYRIDNGNRLVRTDGGECWPGCQDLSQDAHGEDAFSVTYYQGAAPDNTILWAVGRLATEFYKACTGDACSLPAGTVSVARQGITVEISAGLFPGGKTNIPEVDALIQVYNPFGLKMAPVIASPDTRRARITTVA